jgi:hypothetical protein
MNLPRVKGFTIVLVVLVVAAGIGLTIMYAQNYGAAKEKSDVYEQLAMTEALSRIESRSWHQLAKVSQNLTNASVALRSIGLDGSEARAVMADLWSATQPYSVDIVTVDRDGFIVAAYPAQYQSSEGKDIGNQTQIVTLHRTLMPVMSDIFTMVEGFEASDMEVPVFDANGAFNGSVSVTINIQQMVKDIVKAEMPARFQFTCLQPDGMEVYDTDEAQIGRNLFTDPIYQNFTEVLTFMSNLVKTPQGHGTYSYLRSVSSGEVVNKEVYWSSFGFYGAEWRLLVIRAM